MPQVTRMAVFIQLKVVPIIAIATVTAIVIIKPNPIPPSILSPISLVRSPMGALDAAAFVAQIVGETFHLDRPEIPGFRRQFGDFGVRVGGGGVGAAGRPVRDPGKHGHVAIRQARGAGQDILPLGGELAVEPADSSRRFRTYVVRLFTCGNLKDRLPRFKSPVAIL